MGFKNLGSFSIGASETFRLDGWTWPDGKDHGVQYFSAHPLEPDAMLIMTDQLKVMNTDGTYSYGFRVTNAGPSPVNFNVEGGGVDDSFKGAIDSFVLMIPGEGNDGDGAPYSDDFHYQTLTPLDPNGALITMQQFAHQQYLPFAPSDGDGFFGCWSRNDGPNRVAVVVEGGTLFGSWRAKGVQTIVDGASIRFDGWSWSDGADHGPQWFMAVPTHWWGYIGTLTTFEQSKLMESDGRFSYGFRVRASLDYSVSDAGVQSMPFRVWGGHFS